MRFADLPLGASFTNESGEVFRKVPIALRPEPHNAVTATGEPMAFGSNAPVEQVDE